MRATEMNNTPDKARDRDIRLENFAAELTGAVYPLVLRRRPKALWITVELALWRALAATVKKWARQRSAAASAGELEAWREALLADLTESAFYIAVKNGTKGSLLDLELGLYQAVHLVIRTHSRVRQTLRYT
jgi:hypothetical protein